MEKEIKVSIICNAYNHEKYIRDALDGFIMQKTNFKYEILIHDDASTDRTADIIREYEKKYPEIIKPIYQTENQYSKGNGTVSHIQYSRALGEYIAICEGDDYWTDPLKLQKQFDAMELHPEVDICACRTMVVNSETKKIIEYIAPANEDKILSTESVILGGGGYVVTASLFFRSKLNENKPNFRKKFPMDYSLQVMGSLNGGILYLNDCMVAYRFLANGSWTSSTMKSPQKRVESLRKSIILNDMINEDTNYKYSDTIAEANLKLEFRILKVLGKYKECKQAPYLTIYNNLPFKAKTRMFLEQYLTFIVFIYSKIKERGYLQWVKQRLNRE